MVSMFTRRRCGPIGVDLGSYCVKLVQFECEGSELREAARWDLPRDLPAEPAARDAAIVEAIAQARQGRNFRGREAVLCLSSRDLFVQNVRIPPATGDELPKVIRGEISGRLPFEADQAEIRFLDVGDVRQGTGVRRELVVLATPKPTIARLIGLAEQAHLIPVAIEVAPLAMLRSYTRQYRRDEDAEARVMFVNLGATTSTIVIARGADAMFVKFIELGGRQMDDAVAGHLKLSTSEASSLRRHSGDRRTDQPDPDVLRSLGEAMRPVLEQLANELSLCLRYHSVTFRGQPVARTVLSGGEANPVMAEWLAQRLDVPCELGNPLRPFRKSPPAGRITQWDVAAGLALREVPA